MNPPTQFPKWPAGCTDPESCARHKQCMYFSCDYAIARRGEAAKNADWLSISKKETAMDDMGMHAMLELSDADFLRGLKTDQEYLPIVRVMNERLERIAASMEKPPASLPRAPVATGWAVQREDGVTVVAAHPGATERHAWGQMECFSQRAVDEAKRLGARAFRVEVFAVEEGK